jgi:hypothetical protein
MNSRILITPAALLALVLVVGLALLACPPQTYPDVYNTPAGDDDDDSAGDDDDFTGDDDTTTGDDDDDTPWNCTDLCASSKADCVDWEVTLASTCPDFCAANLQYAHLQCVKDCPEPPPQTVCVCTQECLAEFLPEE